MRITLVGISMLLTISTSAQIQFATIGARWLYEISYKQFNPPFNEYFDLYEIHISRDTLINNIEYKIATRTSLKYFFGTGNKHDVLLRQDGGKVYIHFDKDYLLYDFDANVNEIFESHIIRHGIIHSLDVRVEEVSYDTLSGALYKIQTVTFPCCPALGRTILHQKYGCLSNMMDLLFPEIVYAVDDYYTPKLKCYFENNTLIRNFDSVPCDSVQADKIKISTYSPPKKIEPYLYFNKQNNKLKLINQNADKLKELVVFKLSGTPILVITLNEESINDIHSDVIIPGLYFYTIIGSTGLTGGKFIIY